MKYLVHSLTIFSSILLIETGIISIVTWSFPNHIEFTLIHNLVFFFELFTSNPLAAIDLLFVNNPVFIIQSIDILNDNQIWGIYLMPISIITLFALSVFVTWIKHLSPSPGIWRWLLLASAILSISVFYLKIQTCCTTNPSWALEIMLLSRIYNPVLNAIFWQDMYLLVTPWFKAIQLAMVSGSLLIFYMCISSCQSNKQKNL